jgi:ubiquinone/menaquinone biosynthesis C-methylase UbiE
VPREGPSVAVTELTARQLREIEYHAHHAALLRNKTVSYEVLSRRKIKWWNHYWVSHSALLAEDIAGKRLLVPGCGEGSDAIIAAKLGAVVTAFDISPDMLAVARKRVLEAGVEVELLPMAAEDLSCPNNTFDVIYVRDVLHHCDIVRSIRELLRVARPGALVVIDELYTHSLLQQLRNSGFGRWLYPMVRPIIYDNEPAYITQDERKLNEGDLDCILEVLCGVRCQFFNAVVYRLLPAWDVAEIADRVLMHALPGRLVAGRFVLSGRVPD